MLPVIREHSAAGVAAQAQELCAQRRCERLLPAAQLAPRLLALRAGVLAQVLTAGAQVLTLILATVAQILALVLTRIAQITAQVLALVAQVLTQRGAGTAGGGTLGADVAALLLTQRRRVLTQVLTRTAIVLALILADVARILTLALTLIAQVLTQFLAGLCALARRRLCKGRAATQQQKRSRRGRRNDPFHVILLKASPVVAI